MSRFISFLLTTAALAGVPASAQTQGSSLPSPSQLPACSGDELPGDVVAVDLPTIGVEHTVGVGEAALVGDHWDVLERALHITRPISLVGQHEGSSFTIDIAAGTLRGIDLFSILQHASFDSYHLAGAALRVTGKDGQPGRPSKANLWLSTREQGRVLHADVKFGSEIVPIDLADPPITRDLCSRPNTHRVRREILYGGVAHGIVTLQYREFVNGLARPSFNQEGTFDLSAGKEIAFKGARMTLLEANNTGLRYVITKGFDE